jgi:hypothetical protein
MQMELETKHFGAGQSRSRCLSPPAHVMSYTQAWADSFAVTWR